MVEVTSETMATITQTKSAFAALPEVPADVFTAPLRRPAHVGEDWLEPKQRDYSFDEDAIWNDLFERGRAAGASGAASAGRG